MDKSQLAGQFGELEEQIEGFLRRGNTKEEGRTMLVEHSASIVGQIPDMGEIIVNDPVYAAMAFLGKFHFVDEAVCGSLVEGTSPQSLDILRERKALQVDQEVKPAWDFLSVNYPEALCDVVALCFMVHRNRKLAKAVSGNKRVPA